MPLRLLTIGHSQHAWPAFLELLMRHGVQTVLDVRSHPVSRFRPHFNQSRLAAGLQEAGIGYEFLGKELGARRSEPECYEEGQARYDRIAGLPIFQAGLQRIEIAAQQRLPALLCSERDPTTCHRMVLVCRELHRGAPRAWDFAHILADGTLEAQAEAEDRLLRLHFPDAAGQRSRSRSLFECSLFESRAETLEAAYDRQALAIAFSHLRDSRDKSR